MTMTVFVCGRPRVDCSSHDCSKRAEAKCQFPIKREGVQVECLRPVCGGCAVTIEGKVYCAAHGRVVKARKA